MADQVQNIIIKYKADVKELEKGLSDLEVSVDGIQKKTKESSENLQKSFDVTEEKVSTLSSSLGKLAKITVAAFAVKAIFEFGKAIVQASLASDQLAPKIELLQANYEKFLDTLGKSGGVTDTLDATVTQLNDLLDISNKILGANHKEGWDKLGKLIKIAGLEFIGLTREAEKARKAMNDLTPETEKVVESLGGLKKELAILKEKAFKEFRNDGLVWVSTVRLMRLKTDEITAAELALKEAIHGVTFELNEQEKAAAKAIIRRAEEAERIRAKAQEEFERLQELIKSNLAEEFEPEVGPGSEAEDRMNQENIGDKVRRERREKELTEQEEFEKSYTDSFDRITESWDKEAEEANTVYWDGVLANQAKAKDSIKDLALHAVRMGDIFSLMFKAAGKEGEKFAEFQRTLATFKILVNQSIAISDAVRAGAAGSITPIDLAIKIATAIATVVASITIAKKSLNAAGSPPKFGEGGWVNGLPHTYGGTPILGEKDEFVIKAVEARKNAKLIEAINKGYGEKYIIESYLPKLKKYEDSGDKSFANNIVNSIAMGSYNDRRLRDAVMLGYRKGDKNTNKIVQAIKSNNSSNHRGW